MKKEAKEKKAVKGRVIVLEKGKNVIVNSGVPCCGTTFMPIRFW